MTLIGTTGDVPKSVGHIRLDEPPSGAIGAGLVGMEFGPAVHEARIFND